MGVTFKTTPKGKATIDKVVTDKKTGNVISEDHLNFSEVLGPAGSGMAIHVGPSAEVSYTAGFTKGMPNYSAARIDITLKMPCDPGDIDATYEFTEKWVSDRLEKQYGEL
jgi:hypothetical protein